MRVVPHAGIAIVTLTTWVVLAIVWRTFINPHGPIDELDIIGVTCFTFTVAMPLCSALFRRRWR